MAFRREPSRALDTPEAVKVDRAPWNAADGTGQAKSSATSGASRGRSEPCFAHTRKRTGKGTEDFAHGLARAAATLTAEGTMERGDGELLWAGYG